MKSKMKLLAGTFLVALLLFTVSCREKAEKTAEPEAVEAQTSEKQGKEYDSAYVCPMHCEGSGSETEGNCPSCGMAYVANEEHTKDGHTH